MPIGEITLDRSAAGADKTSPWTSRAQAALPFLGTSLMSRFQRPILLLVEDSDDDAFFFRHALKKTGIACSVFHVGDGAAAIDYLKKAAAGTDTETAHPWPDLVFLDLKLPTFSGFEILAWARDQKLQSRLDVSILSGSEHRSDVERARALGASSYLVKPVSSDQLRDRVRVWSETRAAATGAPIAHNGVTGR